MKVVFGFTTLEQDLHMSDAELNAAYERQWAEFERSRWWPWYEVWGVLFFAHRVHELQG